MNRISNIPLRSRHLSLIFRGHHDQLAGVTESQDGRKKEHAPSDPSVPGTFWHIRSIHGHAHDSCRPIVRGIHRKSILTRRRATAAGVCMIVATLTWVAPSDVLAKNWSWGDGPNQTDEDSIQIHIENCQSKHPELTELGIHELLDQSCNYFKPNPAPTIASKPWYCFDQAFQKNYEGDPEVLIFECNGLIVF